MAFCMFQVTGMLLKNIIAIVDLCLRNVARLSNAKDNIYIEFYALQY